MTDVNGSIIETATRLFLANGIRNIRMDDIASEMSISKRTIYEQLVNKDNLIRYSLDNLIRKQREASDTILGANNNVVEAIIAFLKKGNEILLSINPLFFKDLKRYYPEIWEEMVRRNNQSNYQTTRELLARGVKEGFYRKEININLVARIFVEQLNIFSNHEFFSSGEFSVTEVFNNLVINYTRGIATPEGVKLIDECSARELPAGPGIAG